MQLNCAAHTGLKRFLTDILQRNGTYTLFQDRATSACGITAVVARRAEIHNAWYLLKSDEQSSTVALRAHSSLRITCNLQQDRSQHMWLEVYSRLRGMEHETTSPALHRSCALFVLW